MELFYIYISLSNRNKLVGIWVNVINLSQQKNIKFIKSQYQLPNKHHLDIRFAIH